MPWTFRLNITNGTDRALVVDAPYLNYGVWFTGNTENAPPVNIPPGETVYALGVRAKAGPQGYECSCTWKDSQKPSYGAVALTIDVPYTGHNTSALTVSGFYDPPIGFNVGKNGHNFVQNVTISAKAAGLQISETSHAGDGDEDADYARLVKLEVDSNEMVQNWPELAKLDEVDQFDAVAAIPGTYKYPPKEFFVARGNVTEIERPYWSGIGDPLYRDNYAKQTFAKRYFAVPVYSINTDPRACESVAAGVRKMKMHSVEVSSTIHSTLETNFSIKTSLEAQSDPVASLHVAAKLESEFGIRNVKENSTTRVERDEEEIDIGPIDYDRLFVPWVFSTTAIIFCEKKDGNFRLVAVSEWALQQLYRTYRTTV